MGKVVLPAALGRASIRVGPCYHRHGHVLPQATVRCRHRHRATLRAALGAASIGVSPCYWQGGGATVGRVPVNFSSKAC